MTTKIEKQNVALVYLEQPQSNSDEVAELKELVRSAFGEVVLFVSQNRNFADPKTMIGSGKLQELKLAIDNCEKSVDVVIFSQRLNALQRKNIQDVLNVGVVDNVDLILDIFALRATSAEGKKQVELAQISYSLATRPEKDFSRQGGGIGTRGPGETQLETDKRVARAKMHRLREELDQIERQRATTRKKRVANDVFTVALVGYTNAGKSTLFNKITGNNVYADDRLFATLDTTVRKVGIGGTDVLFCDTVGFIRNLPTTLIEAFKSTLEEVTFADLILNVCDISDPNVGNHIAVTEQILNELGTTAPIIRIYNKCDKQFSGIKMPDFSNGKCVYVSALTGKNVDVVLDAVEQQLSKQYATVKLNVPYAENGKIAAQLQKYAREISVKYTDDMAVITTTLKRRYLDLFAKYIVF